MREASRWENQLYDRLSDVLDGFKEVRLNRARSDALFDHCRRGFARRRQYEDSHPKRNLPANGVPAELALHAAGRGGFRGAHVRRGGWSREPSRNRSPRSCSSSAPASASCSRSRSSRPRIRRPIGSSNWKSGCGRSRRLPEDISTEPAKRFSKIEMRDVEFRYVDKAVRGRLQGRARSISR